MIRKVPIGLASAVLLDEHPKDPVGWVAELSIGQAPADPRGCTVELSSYVSGLLHEYAIGGDHPFEVDFEPVIVPRELAWRIAVSVAELFTGHDRSSWIMGRMQDDVLVITIGGFGGAAADIFIEKVAGDLALAADRLHANECSISDAL